MILIVGGLIILTLLGMNFSESYKWKSQIQYYNEALIASSGLGQSIIEQIMKRSFDEKTRTKAVTSTDSLTAVASLGTDSGESNVLLFDDVDDFNNYTRNDTLSIYGIYNISVKVYYNVKMNPNTKSNTRTFSKRVDVKVYNPYLGIDSVKLNHIITY